ncbi:glycosyltransferase family 2 protein [Nitrolancea hollandica]|nr:glycosyltransferase family 2 protein [Nitrolancea hollandica]
MMTDNGSIGTLGHVDTSVVIVSWNTRDLLSRCVASVIRQAEDASLQVEIIVVDNASSDGTTDFLKQEYPGVTVIALQENRGFAAANNLGIASARGATLLLLNPDTEMRPGSLSALQQGLHASPRVGMVGARLLNPDGSLQSAGYRFPGLVQTFLDIFPVHPRLVGSRLNGRVPPGDGLSPFAIDHPLGACMLVRRAVIEQVGMLDDQYFMYSEEIDWCRRIKAAGWAILTVPAARVIHYGGQSTGQMLDAMFLQLHRSRNRYFRRYHSPAFVSTVGTLMRIGAACQTARARFGRNAGHAQRAAALAKAADQYRYPESDDA